MARVLEPFKQFFEVDASGNTVGPLINGWLSFLESGTNNTNKNTYSDVNETIPNTNPVQLDAEGRTPNIFGSGTYRVISWTNDVTLNQPSEQIQVKDPVGSGSSEGDFSDWVATGTYDITDIVKGSDNNYYRSLINDNEDNDPTSSTTTWEQIDFVYFYNANKTYSTGDLVRDSDGLSYISKADSNIGNTPTSSPTKWGFKIGSPLDSNSFQIQESKGADVASATELPILTDGNYFDVTGTTTITSIATTGRIGTYVKLHFDAALILTHNATDLFLPGEANITTVAGDEAEFIEYASGDWRCTNYQKVDGSSLVGTILGTPVASTSGTSITFNDIPSGTKKIKVSFVGVSTDGTSIPIIQIGDAGGLELSAYVGTEIRFGTTTNHYGVFSTGFKLNESHIATLEYHGTITLTLENSVTNTWTYSSTLSASETSYFSVGAGSKSLSGEIDRISITTVNGTDAFDAGEINILYE